jgi:hypothetical protein
MKANHRELEVFHQTLVRRLKSRQGWDLTTPLTVAEIYRDLVPHQSSGEELGMETHTEYEQVLLRLLAGEGEYMALDSEAAVQGIRAELASPVPDTGLYRDHARAFVRLNPARLD